MGIASVPAGASRGAREAVELRDEDPSRFLGKGVDKAVDNVKKIIFPKIKGMEVTEQQAIDDKMIALDGTNNKSRLGANATLGVSLAVAKAAAADLEIPTYKYIGKLFGEPNPIELPVPLLNFLNGGAHASNNLAFQEFMIMPLGAKNFFEALRMASELFSILSTDRIKRFNYSGVGDEGGFSPIFDLASIVNAREDGDGTKVIYEALDMLMEGIRLARYEPGKDIAIALDPAASEFYKNRKYVLHQDQALTSDEMIDLYSDLVDKYPIVSIEDGLAEDDFDGWKKLTEQLGNKVQLVGDDLFVTNPKIFKEGIKNGLANAILIKVNQIGTLSETLNTVKLAHKSGYNAVISHRSGETEDTIISDIAVGCNAGQIKTGCLSRTERTAKYNRLLRIDKRIGEKAYFPGHDIFPRSISKYSSKSPRTVPLSTEQVQGQKV